MRVELGAGAHSTGWVRVDINPKFRPDIIASADHLPFAAETVTALRAVDVLEHLSYRDTDRVLAEWCRVCQPGADVYIQVPDALTICQWLAANDDRLLHVPPDIQSTHLSGAQWRLLGGHADGTYADEDGWRFNAHYAMFSRGSLHLALTRAGFDVRTIETNRHPNLLCRAVR